jgi:hypothetical protein
MEGAALAVLRVALVAGLLFASATATSPAVSPGLETVRLVAPSLPAHGGPPPDLLTVASSAQRASTSAPLVPATTPSNPARTAVFSPLNATGIEYSGSPATASNVSVGLRVPDDVPVPYDRYSVALSLFDSARSYDQVGLASVNGSWSIYYATDSNCATRLTTHWGVSSLERGKTYTFAISAQAGGAVEFSAALPSAPPAWTQTFYTGGSSLELEATQTCGNATLPGYTEAQVVYNATFGSPPYNFLFTNASEDLLPETSWAVLPNSSVYSDVVSNGSTATIFNEPFGIAFSPRGADNQTIESSDEAQVVRSKVSVMVPSTAPANVTLAPYTLPAFWNFSATPDLGFYSYIANVSIVVPGGAVPGTYLVGIAGTEKSGPPNRIAFTVTILAHVALTVLERPPSGRVDANETVVFTAQASDGSAGYLYSWPQLPAGCLPVNGSTTSCRFPTAGTFELEGDVVDALHYGQSETLDFQVLSDPVLSVGQAHPSIALGSHLALSLTLAGGMPPFAISWSGLPPGCPASNATTLSCTPDATGQYELVVLATDATGFRTSLPIALSVTAPSGGLPGSTDALLLVGGALVVLIAACAVVLVRRHRA